MQVFWTTKLVTNQNKGGKIRYISIPHLEKIDCFACAIHLPSYDPKTVVLCLFGTKQHAIWIDRVLPKLVSVWFRAHTLLLLPPLAQLCSNNQNCLVEKTTFIQTIGYIHKGFPPAWNIIFKNISLNNISYFDTNCTQLPLQHRYSNLHRTWQRPAAAYFEQFIGPNRLVCGNKIFFFKKIKIGPLLVFLNFL